MIRLGGMRTLKVPEMAMAPRDSLVSYPAFSISGKQIRPKVAVAARLEPEMAPKMALATIMAEHRLPGRLPNIFSAPRKSPLTIPVLA